MAKSLVFRIWLVLVLLLVPTLMSAQDVVDSIEVDPYEGMIIETYETEDGGTASDTIYLDNQDDDLLSITQYDLKDFDWVDICYNPKYAIVTKDGKKGIYDLMLHKNITEIEFRELGYSRQTEAEDSTNISMFYAKKGIKHGILGVSESTNDVLSIWMDDPDEVYSLEECTTIDKKISKHTEKLLEAFILQQQMDNAQIVILDAKTGRLKTWIALDANMEKEDAGKLLAHSCSGSLTKPFHTVMALEKEGMSLDSVYNGVSYWQGIKSLNNEVMHQAINRGYRRSVAERKWKDLTDTQNPSTSPFILAIGYNSLVNHGAIIIPTMKADSVNVEENVFTSSNLVNLRNVLFVNRAESPQLAWLSDKIEWLGYTTKEIIYSPTDEEQMAPVGTQIQFAGVFPAENPRYTICIVGDKLSINVTPVIFQDIVNTLASWLLKK